MQRTDFILTINGKAAKGVFRIGFDRHNKLALAEVCEGTELDDNQRTWFFAWLPIDFDGFLEKARLPVIDITPVEADLSFDRFWNSYGYKVGKKQKAIKLWEAMTEEERVLCLKAVPKYRYWLAQKTNMEQKYPEGFLSERRWENTYTVK